MRRDRDGRLGKGDRTHGVLIVAVVLLVAVVFTLTGCPKKPPHKRLPPGARVPPKEVREPAMAPQMEVGPERQASERLVEKGRALMDGADYERAAVALRDAVGVDTTNGHAYYYLAVAQAALDRPDVAMGLLDKAEALLAHDEEWRSRIDDFRKELGSQGPGEIAPSPIDQAF